MRSRPRRSRAPGGSGTAPRACGPRLRRARRDCRARTTRRRGAPALLLGRAREQRERELQTGAALLRVGRALRVQLVALRRDGSRAVAAARSAIGSMLAAARSSSAAACSRSPASTAARACSRARSLRDSRGCPVRCPAERDRRTRAPPPSRKAPRGGATRGSSPPLPTPAPHTRVAGATTHPGTRRRAPSPGSRRRSPAM